MNVLDLNHVFDTDNLTIMFYRINLVYCEQLRDRWAITSLVTSNPNVDN